MHERKIDSAVDALTLGRPGVKSAETSTNLFSPHFVPLAARWTLIAIAKRRDCLKSVIRFPHEMSYKNAQPVALKEGGRSHLLPSGRKRCMPHRRPRTCELGHTAVGPRRHK